MSAVEFLLVALQRVVDAGGNTADLCTARAQAKQALTAYHHAMRTLPVDTVVPCPVCAGSGQHPVKAEGNEYDRTPGKCWPCDGSGAVPPGVVHIAGPPLYIGTALLRQRCSWCGVILTEATAGEFAMPVDQIDQSKSMIEQWPVWPTFELILQDGAASSVMSGYPHDAPLPANCCARPQVNEFNRRNPR